MTSTRCSLDRESGYFLADPLNERCFEPACCSDLRFPPSDFMHMLQPLPLRDTASARSDNFHQLLPLAEQHAVKLGAARSERAAVLGETRLNASTSGIAFYSGCVQEIGFWLSKAHFRSRLVVDLIRFVGFGAPRPRLRRASSFQMGLTSNTRPILETVLAVSFSRVGASWSPFRARWHSSPAAVRELHIF